MLVLLGILFRWLIIIGAVKLDNIICQFILISATFQLTLTNGKYLRDFMLEDGAYITHQSK